MGQSKKKKKKLVGGKRYLDHTFLATLEDLLKRYPSISTKGYLSSISSERRVPRSLELEVEEVEEVEECVSEADGFKVLWKFATPSSSN